MLRMMQKKRQPKETITYRGCWYSISGMHSRFRHVMKGRYRQIIGPEKALALTLDRVRCLV